MTGLQNFPKFSNQIYYSKILSTPLRMNRTAFFLGLSLSLLTFRAPLPAQQNLAYYLDQGRANNPYARQLDRRQAAAALEMQKISAQYEQPSLALAGDILIAPYFFNYRRIVALSANPDPRAFGYDAAITNGGNYSGQVEADYPILTKKIRQPLLDQQVTAQRQAANQRIILELNLEQEITAGYLNALLIQQQMEYLRQVIGQLQQQRELVRRLADRGVRTITDLQLLDIEIQTQQYQLGSLRIQLRQAMLTLTTSAGMADTTLYHLDTVQLAIRREDNPSVFLENNRLDSLAARNDEAVFNTRYLPQVNAYANAGLNAVEWENAYRRVGISGGLRLSWLLRDGGQRSLNEQQVQLRLLDAHDIREFVDRQVLQNRQSLRLLLSESRENIDRLTQQVQSYESVLNALQRELASGQVSVIDYLNVWRSYNDLFLQRTLAEGQLLLLVNELNYWNH